MIIVSGSEDGKSTLNTLIRNLRYIDYNRQTGSIIIEKGGFITPLSLLPVTAYLHKHVVEFDYKDDTNYLDTIKFPYGVDLDKTQDFSGTYIPITRVDLATSEYHMENQIAKCSSVYLDLLHNNIIEDPEFLERVGKNVTGLLLTEMLGNVEEHSITSNFFLFSQYFHENNSCEICLVDLGIGIRGSLYNAGFKGIFTDREALELVIRKQVSAKDKTGRDRGYGIKHVRSLLSAEEINGFFLIVSGDIAYYCDSKERLFIDLGDFSWPGTIVAMRFSKPYNKFNFSKYVT